ncbi:predicted protein [Sclerotinia sclerotiorum 1980 UF-70]|uniref:Uncharacterized protein n=1 Tax=Sclerotinia sclerotiorum (strain ATCC 18683 / 1980 / Ss-1) TaxID=665079 RepID=A7EZT8_SCLS1|nr:predicted protein [Sclerotinia sclerotiorum 1980 UF-70]EDN94980.1 predicted protein [Sclerotinia sclerotiorum 1980 UF-70]
MDPAYSGIRIVGPYESKVHKLSGSKRSNGGRSLNVGSIWVYRGIKPQVSLNSLYIG